ncbi:MAG: homoserine O-succinyltransferase [Defluviitaleaceae bacterium]|nr:homoserine O-succinyltransferase [Defluviitaleaceae bacterium]
MPIKVPDKLPAKEVLKLEKIFVMDESRAFTQDIRPLEIAIVNLMPLKEPTEVQLLRLLGNTPLQINITLLHMASHTSKNTAADHLSAFYHVFEQARKKRFDGMIITGAPVETLAFEQVTYWDELCSIMAWSLENVTSVLHICWAAQAGLYYHYGIKKQPTASKVFGIFSHTKSNKTAEDSDILRGFDDVFFAPHSRHTTVSESDIVNQKNLTLLATSPQVGVYIAASTDLRRHIFVTGHPEYDPLTLKQEYLRDKEKGLQISPPENYFPNNDSTAPPIVAWRSHANLLFSNWLNYCVYQETPYRL